MALQHLTVSMLRGHLVIGYLANIWWISCFLYCKQHVLAAKPCGAPAGCPWGQVGGGTWAGFLSVRDKSAVSGPRTWPPGPSPTY